jgi:hypothetical protein
VRVVVEVRTPTGVLEGGGKSPSPPVEPAMKVLLPTVKFALPNETVVGLGGISPLPAMLLLVAVDPDCVKGPTVTVTTTNDGGGAMPSEAVETSVLVDAEIVKLLPSDGAGTLDELTDAGGNKPSPPVEAPVAVDPEVEKSALPALMMVVVLEITEALGTGGMTPPFPVEV